MHDAEDLLGGMLEALTASPDNVPLRKQVGRLLLSRGRVDEAERVYRDGSDLAPQSEAMKLGLAQCFHRQGKHSAALVLVEELLKRADATPEVRLLHARLLLRGGDVARAATAYRHAVRDQPKLADAELAEALGVDADDDADADDGDGDDEVDAAGRVRVMRAEAAPGQGGFAMEKPRVTFDDVGGMDSLKDEIRIKIIQPLQHPELYKAYGKAIGGGILMYGPPGCGKTHLARATAGQVQASFISVGVHDVLDMYLGNSEQKLHALFEQARSHTPCVLFFDEVDALGARRTDMRGSAGRQVINQFLAELDGVNASNEGVLILAATNAPWHLDSAFRRPGRFDRVIFVPPPDRTAAAAILRVLLKGKPQGDVDIDTVAGKCSGFSGADLKAVIDLAIEAKLREAMKTGTPAPLVTRDLTAAAKQVKPSTKEWFATARNHALYSNEGGVYDDILNHLKLR